MDVGHAGEAPETGADDELESRAPRDDDLVLICRCLNELGADYWFLDVFSGTLRRGCLVCQRRSIAW